MPIGFADLLQTNAQYVNGLNKGIVSTDDVYGGLRSKIDDWTEFHLSTKTNDSNVTYRTFQDDGTGAAPGQFKAYSTILYVADGRPLIQDNDAAGGTYIELDASGDFTTAGNGTRFVAQGGTAEPAYYVLTDASQIGGTGTGTDKLPSFTISGDTGTETGTAVPAGYTLLSTVDSTIGTGGYTSWTITGDGGDTEAITNGLTVDFAGGTAITTAYNAAANTLTINHDDTSTDGGVGAQSGADVISMLTLDTYGHVTATATRALTAGDLGLGAVENAAASGLYVKLDGSSTIAGGSPLTFEGATNNDHQTTLAVTDPTADRTVTLPNATGTVALTANKLSDFAATTSAELAGTISDETGSGALVFADSPTLITPALGTPASGDLSACTFPTLNQDTTGSALTLTNGRTFKVDLASTSASTAFDGSANITDVGVNGTLAVANGGTGLTDISTLLNSNVTPTTLSLVIGENVQAYDAQLADVAGLSPADSHFIVGNGTNFITETGATARTSLGLGSIATQAADSVTITGGTIDGTTIGATTASSGAFTTITASDNVTISGNLTVSGDVIQANSTTVDFEDAVLALGVPRDDSTNLITDGTSTIDTDRKSVV